jgi:hypothetical protein
MQAYREDIQLLAKSVYQNITSWVKLQAEVTYDYDTFATQHGIVALRALFDQLAAKPFALKLSAREHEAMQLLYAKLTESGIAFIALQSMLSDMLTNLRPSKGKWLFDIAWSRGLLVEAVVVLWPKIQSLLNVALQQRILVPKLNPTQQNCAIVTAQQTQRLLAAKESLQAFNVSTDPSLTTFMAITRNH